MASVNDIHNLGDQFQYQIDKLEEADIDERDRGAPQNSVQAIYDIRSLELACSFGYDMGRFLMTTENRYNWQEPQGSEIRETFGIYKGRTVSPGDELVATTQTSRNVLDDRDRLRMEGSYEFEWDGVGMDFRFLSVPVG